MSLRPLNIRGRRLCFLDFQGHRTIINGLKRQLESPPSYESLSYLLAELQYAMDDNPEITLAGRDFIMAYSGYIKKWAATDIQ